MPDKGRGGVCPLLSECVASLEPCPPADFGSPENTAHNHVGKVLVSGTAGAALWRFALACLFLAVGACASSSDDTSDVSDAAISAATSATTQAATSTSSPATPATPTTTQATTSTTQPATETSTTTGIATTTTSTDRIVTIRSVSASYTSGDAVEFVVTNGLADPITAQDQQAFCTIVRVDQLVGDAWVEAAPCVSGPPPSDVVLNAESAMTIELPLPLESGTYRARLVYSIGLVFVPGKTLEAETATFTVE